MISEDAKLTDVQAIMTYIANKYCPEIVARTPEEKSRSDMLYLLIKDV